MRHRRNTVSSIAIVILMCAILVQLERLHRTAERTERAIKRRP
jgi:hypothetical protein